MDSNASISYTFTLEEACAAAYGTGRLRPYKKRSIFQSIVALFAIAFFLNDIIRHPGDVFAYIMILISVILLVSCNIFPKRAENEFMDEYGMLLPRHVIIENDCISLELDGRIIKINPKDIINSGTVGDIIVITAKNGCTIELPVRAATDEQLIFLDKIIHSSNH